MAKALIVGAGAIGRGYLPWVLDEFELDFYDESSTLIRALNDNGGYRSYMSTDRGPSERVVRPRVATDDITDLVLSEYDVAFIAVGPRNTNRLPGLLSELVCPVFSLENDPLTVSALQAQHGLRRVFFGVPDVITSSTASPEHLAIDPLALHTEDGILYLEDSALISTRLKAALQSVQWAPVERMRSEWDAKLFLHNTPHCVAAYLGFMAGCTYLHEGIRIPFIRRTVEGVIEEMLLALKMATSYGHDFMEEYAAKELRRFANPDLFDPIRRVGREPLRKLAPSGRLTGALQIAMLSGVAPVNVMIGITAALQYSDPADPDSEYIRLVADFGLPAFLAYHLSIEPASLESQYIVSNYGSAMQLLKGQRWI